MRKGEESKKYFYIYDKLFDKYEIVVVKKISGCTCLRNFGSASGFFIRYPDIRKSHKFIRNIDNSVAL